MSLPNFNPAAACAIPCRNLKDALLHRLSFVISGMRHQKLRANGDGALELSPERLHRLRPDDVVRRRKIDQVVVMDNQRCQIMLFARPVQQRDRRGAR